MMLNKNLISILSLEKIRKGPLGIRVFFFGIYLNEMLLSD
jgi:hypothetical protein